MVFSGGGVHSGHENGFLQEWPTHADTLVLSNEGMKGGPD